jgi:uncharacterized protein YjbI with pentapeptide repeats
VYSSRRRNHGPVSLRPFGARSSHWYIPHSASRPLAGAYLEGANLEEADLAVANLKGANLGRSNPIKIKLESGRKRHEFQADHGFRKWFKTRCEIAGMRSINIETLMPIL